MYQAVIIDDEKWVVKSLAATIKDQELFHIAAEFYDGLTGLEYIRNNQPHLAFVDVRIPGMGGLDILQVAREEGLSTLFIMISGHAEFAYAQKAMFHNAIGYCLKPFSRSELMDAMQKAASLISESEESTYESPEITSFSSPCCFDELVVSHKAVRMMIEYAKAHYQEDISIQALAEHCCINPNYASQIFKQETGYTFVSFLTHLRVERARWLLSHTDQNVYLIASQTGYPDYFYFAKVFKRLTGLTPTAYRKKSDSLVDRRSL